jgi:hypothetical protein
MIGVAVVAVITALIVIIVMVINNRTPSAIREPDDLPTADVTGWDDSSPLPSGSPTGRPVSCDQYTDNKLPEPPSDRRVHGGPLSFAQLHDWSEPRPTSRFPYSRDAHNQQYVLPEDLPWAASAYAGVSTVPDYRDGGTATAQLLQCVVTSDFYTSVDVRVTENLARSIKISNTPAVQRDALLQFEHPELKTTGSRLRIIIVESQPMTFYFHAVPMERDDLIKDLDTATASLQLE